MYKRVKAVFEIIPKARFKAMELLEAHVSDDRNNCQLANRKIATDEKGGQKGQKKKINT